MCTRTHLLQQLYVNMLQQHVYNNIYTTKSIQPHIQYKYNQTYTITNTHNACNIKITTPIHQLPYLCIQPLYNNLNTSQ